jgi:hypothetical protein
MPNKGADLGADLYELWRAGRDNLPSVAQVYKEAGRNVEQAAARLGTVFLRPSHLAGPYGPAYAHWKELCDDLSDILLKTATSLDLTGKALCLAAHAYAETDRAAADEFNRLRQINDDLG